MKNTADVRKDNISNILNILCDNLDHTVLSVSNKTGLSVATCNTLLKMLVDTNRVIGTKRQINGVGRSSIVYHINPFYCSYINIQYFQGAKLLKFIISYLYGTKIKEYTIEIDSFDNDIIINEIKKISSEYENVKLVQLSLPLYLWDKQNDIKDRIIKETNINTYVGNKYEFISKGIDGEGLITLVDLKTINPIVINIKNNDLLAGRMLQNINYELLFGNIKEVSNLAKCIAINILYTFPDNVLIVGDISIDKLLIEMKPYTESPIPNFKIIEEINSYCEIGMEIKSKEILNEMI